jgi:hypothetical protein
VSVLNQIQTNNSYANTGFSGFIEFKKIIGVILCLNRLEWDKTALAQLQTTMQTAAKNPDYTKRIFPFYNIEQCNDSSEDLIMASMNYGGKFPVRDGDYDWTFEFIKGGQSLTNSLRKFNGKSVYALFVDDSGTVIGYRNGDKLSFVPLKVFYADKFKLNDGTKPTGHAVKIIQDSRYLNDYLGYAEADFDVATTITPLQDLEIVANVLPTVGKVVKIGTRTKSDGLSVYSTLKTALANASNFIVKDAATGTVITTTVTSDDTTSSTVLTCGTTGYPTSPGNITIELAGLASLDAGLQGFEGSNVLTLPVA